MDTFRESDYYIFFDALIDRYSNLKYHLLEAQTFDVKHFGFPEIYYKIMETDRTRVDAFTRAFELYNNMSGAIVCEAWVGTLALTKHYLPYVKKAYLIENNPHLRDFIIQQISHMWYADKVELIFGDATQVQLPEQVDYIVGELMSIFCANEFQVQIFGHLRQFLKPTGKLLPEKIINLAQLCHAEFEHNHKHYPLCFVRHFPEFLTKSEVINTIDLYTESDYKVDIKTDLVGLLGGVANALYMQSYVQIANGINFTGTDSLMPPTVCKLGSKIPVHPGQNITLHSVFEYGTSLDDAVFDI